MAYRVANAEMCGQLRPAIQESSVASAPFRHTSEIELTLFERVQVGQGIVDELGSESHPCDVGVSVVL